MRKIVTVVVCALGLGFMAPGVAQAAPVTFDFKVTIVGLQDSGGQLLGRAEAGQELSGRLTFDAAAPDEAPDDPALGLYNFRFTGSWVFDSPRPLDTNIFGIRIENNNSDGHDLLGLTAVVPFQMGASHASLHMGLFDELGSLFASDALPTASAPANIGGSFSLAGYDVLGEYHWVLGHVTSFERVGGNPDPGPGPGPVPPAVPEPASLVLLGTGLAGLVRFRRRSTAAAHE